MRSVEDEGALKKNISETLSTHKLSEAKLQQAVDVLMTNSLKDIRKKVTEASIDLAPGSKQSRLHTRIKKAIGASLDVFKEDIEEELYESISHKFMAWIEFATWHLLEEQDIKERAAKRAKRTPEHIGVENLLA
ncbi:MAG: hypothetical protein CMI26_10675 [Opitutae bacterium]|nr:hypothetical protein [Opitutae bacterium]|tara:strand:+ start:152 stop:553 length:402 start_codon:yes stop_codon:yes gene_type:complete